MDKHEMIGRFVEELSPDGLFVMTKEKEDKLELWISDNGEVCLIRVPLDSLSLEYLIDLAHMVKVDNLRRLWAKNKEGKLDIEIIKKNVWISDERKKEMLNAIEI